MSGSRSKQVRQAELKVISDKLDEWQTDEQIIKELKISRATYYRYKQQIFKQDTKLLAKIRKNELAHNILRVRKALEYCIQVNRNICEHSRDARAKTAASAMIVQATVGLMNLDKGAGPNSEQIKIIHRDVTEHTEAAQ